MFGFLRCSLNSHAPRPYRVNWDGESYCSTCDRCGRDIRREARGQWRLWNPVPVVADGERSARVTEAPRS